MAAVSLKLLVDTEENRVVLAESEKDFVDILFSFLTLPMGTVIRLLGKQSSLGCMDKLYESVGNLDTKYFETRACQTMLLEPRSAAEQLCEDLLINADELNPRRLYRCPAFDCFAETNRLYSSIRGACCPCGKTMDTKIVSLKKKSDAKDDVFLKGVALYVISDDLQVAPATSTLSLLQKLGIKNAEALEKRTVDVRRDEVISLLRSLLLSKTPLTDVFLGSRASAKKTKDEDEHVGAAQIKLEKSEVENENEPTQAKTINVKLIQDKVTKNIVYAEGGNDLVDVLFSFLTLPLGSIVKLHKKHSSIGCVDNLYHSVDSLVAAGDFMKSKASNDMLLDPKLYPHFNCNNQIMMIEANQSEKCNAHACETCWYARISASGLDRCKHNVKTVIVTEINTKLPSSGTESGGGYTKRSAKFMVTNEMVVTPLSPTSVLDVIKELKAPVGNLVEEEVVLGESEVLNLLKACLISSNALSSVFFP